MIPEKERWKTVVLVVGTKEYKLRHSYEEVKELLGVEWFYQVTGMQLRIDNIGLLAIKGIAFRSEQSTLVLNCKRN